MLMFALFHLNFILFEGIFAVQYLLVCAFRRLDDAMCHPDEQLVKLFKGF